MLVVTLGERVLVDEDEAPCGEAGLLALLHRAVPDTVPGAWAVPGVPLGTSDRSVAPSADVLALLAALARVLATDPVLLEERVALHRAEALLEVHGRLAGAVLPAVRDVADRELWTHAQVGSTRSWLRGLPSGEGSWLNASTALAARPVLARAVADGDIALRTATAVASGLQRVPDDVEDEQLEAVLVDGVRDVLALWLGAADRSDGAQERYAERRARLDAAVAAGRRALLPADRLEPALTLLASVLPPGEVPACVDLLVDALAPDQLATREEQQWDGRELVLRRLRSGLWDLRGRLCDELGQSLHVALGQHLPDSRDDRVRITPELLEQLAADLRRGQPEDPGADACDDTPSDAAGDHTRSDRACDDTPSKATGDDLAPTPSGEPDELHGRVGPGRPLPPVDPDVPFAADPPEPPAPDGLVTDPPPHLSPGQRLHDALLSLVRSVLALPPRPGRPTPARLLLTAPLAAAASAAPAGTAPGPRQAALPGLAHSGDGRTGSGRRPLSPAALRRLGCTSRITAVLLDALGRPLGVSRPERDADAAERDALRVVWGSACAVRGCSRDAAVPHHVIPFALISTTALADLVPLCEPCHHLVHRDQRQLRLRDDRVIGPVGWVRPVA